MNDLITEFTKLATDGYLGDIDGTDAYAYLRASSERQVEEGSSFPRQLESIHKAAMRNTLRVPFDLIFFDDGFTGFEFEHRPALLKLRYEVASKPRASHIVIEDIDRLSRNADWQQGFLLEEFSRRYIEVHFYISPGSQLERYVRGYIAQEGMKKDIERMRMGNLYKAMSGKVTAKRPRFGYMRTHPQDTQYVLHPEESKVMRWVYEQIIYNDSTLDAIAKSLNDQGAPTRFKTGFWTAGTLYQLVKSPVYKGEFYANRHYGVKTGEFNEKGKPKSTMKERPESEWIKVDVPAIVTPEEWDTAMETLSRHAKKSTRQAKKRDWLLVGFARCAICRVFSFIAVLGNTHKNPRRYYKCNSKCSQKSRILKNACLSPHVHADVLERRVWEELEQVIYDPSIIIRRLQEKQEEERVIGYQSQLDFIDRQLAALTKERAKYEAAYQRDIYTLDEFEEKIKDIRGKVNALEISRTKLEAKVAETHAIEEQKQVVLAALSKIRCEVEQAKQNGQQPQEIPFDLKRKILSLLVDVIWVNVIEKTFTIEGEIKGAFAFGDNDNQPPTPATSGGFIGGSGGFGFTSDLRWR